MDVRPNRGRLAREQFRRHVHLRAGLRRRTRAHHGLGESRPRDPRQVFFRQHLPYAEVGELGLGQFRISDFGFRIFDEDVPRLHVAMDHAGIMRRLQCLRRLGHYLQPRRHCDLVDPALGLTPRFQVLARNVFLFEIERRLIKIDVVQSNNVRMFANPLFQQPEQRHLSL